MKNIENLGIKPKPSLSCKNTERRVVTTKSVTLGFKRSIADLRKRYATSTLKPFNSLIAITQKNLIRKHNSTMTKYCNIKINSIIFNEKSRLVACFKDYLIEDDMSEFLKRYYIFYESLTKLDNILDFYNKYATFYPNYCVLPESRYLYKNIMKKQKIILLLDPHKNRLNKPLTSKQEIILSETIINSIANQTDFTVEENCYQNFVSEAESMNFTPLKSASTKVSLNRLSTSLIELFNFANSNFNNYSNKDDIPANKEATSLNATVRTLNSKSKHSPIGIAPNISSVANSKGFSNSQTNNTRNRVSTRLGKQLQVASISNSNVYSTLQCDNQISKAAQGVYKNASNPVSIKHQEPKKVDANTAKKVKPNLNIDLPKKELGKNIPQSTKNKSSSLPKFESIFKTSSHRTESEPKKAVKLKEETEKKPIKVLKKVNLNKPNYIATKKINNQTPSSCTQTARDQHTNKPKSRKIDVNIKIKAPRKNVKITVDNNSNTLDSKKSKLNWTENGLGSKIICDNSNKPNVNIIIKNIQVVNNYNTINSSYLESKNRMKDRNSIERLVKNHLKPIIESQLLNSHNRMRSASNHCSDKLGNSKPKVTITTSQVKPKG